MLPRLAVIGATGAVGGRVCDLIRQRQFPFASIRFFGSPCKVDRSIEFGSDRYPVEPLSRDRLQDIDLAIASTPDDVALELAPWVIEQGGVLVDESAAHRMRKDVPLVVPEVNSKALTCHNGLIASPNCTTIQLVMCLAPLQTVSPLRRVVVSTYQASSGAGDQARREFVESSQAVFRGEGWQTKSFEVQLANNLIPKIGRFLEDDFTSEETKVIQETRKILDLPDLAICATCVRVPTENCHGEAVNVEFEGPVNCDQVREALAAWPGVCVVDDPPQLKYPTLLSSHERDEVLVGRIRRDDSVEHGICFWCVSDNLRKGAATNAVQIAEQLVRDRG